MKKLVIVLDAGHGGDDNGAVWGYTEEDDTNLSIAYLLRCELKQSGHVVHMTRERDIERSLSYRADFANSRGADLFISIHCDAFHHETASGMSTHIHPRCSARSREIANNIQSSLISSFHGHRNRGIRESNFQVLRETKMPALLIECEFLSNKDTRRFLKEPENQLGLARAIAKGIEVL